MSDVESTSDVGGNVIGEKSIGPDTAENPAPDGSTGPLGDGDRDPLVAEIQKQSEIDNVSESLTVDPRAVAASELPMEEFARRRNAGESVYDAAPDPVAIERDTAVKERDVYRALYRNEAPAEDADVADLTIVAAKINERGRQKYKDYDKVVGQAGISVAMMHGLKGSKNAEDVAFHLGRNPDEATRIEALDPSSQVTEIGRLSNDLARPVKKQTAAPNPVPVLKGSGSVGGRTLAGAKTMADYAKIRQAQIEADRS